MESSPVHDPHVDAMFVGCMFVAVECAPVPGDRNDNDHNEGPTQAVITVMASLRRSEPAFGMLHWL